MSLATWEKEFYGPMEKAVKSKRAALEHSIKKWTGLLAKNRKKHGIEIAYGEIRDETSRLDINSANCALCIKYADGGIKHERCYYCPLQKIRGVACDSTLRTESRSPYASWAGGNPRPMLRWLLKAKEMLDEKAASPRS